jgi:Holliday junction resolvase RusA-like endonuclease
MPDIFTLVLDGPIVPKARARTTRNGTYHPHNYQRWKKTAIASFRKQWTHAPLSGVLVSVVLQGKHSRRGDADNVSGAILDALVQSQVLQDDNLVHVRGLSVVLNWDKNQAPTTEVILERV